MRMRHGAGKIKLSNKQLCLVLCRMRNFNLPSSKLHTMILTVSDWRICWLLRLPHCWNYYAIN